MLRLNRRFAAATARQSDTRALRARTNFQPARGPHKRVECCLNAVGMLCECCVDAVWMLFECCLDAVWMLFE
eukprot:11166832-Lingulodinium_polyedra.AAC.1